MTTALTGLPRAFSPYGVGSYIRFFDDETDTPKDVYSDSSLTTPIADADLVADSASTFPVIFFDPSLYRIKVYNSSNVLKYLQDHFDPGLGAGFGVSSLVGIAQGGTGAGNAAAARSNLGAASSSALTATQDDVTALQTAVATGVNGDGEFGLLAAEDSIARTDLATSFGTIVAQTVDATPYTSYTDITSVIPEDDTIPAVSEGTEVLTANITPGSTTNKVKISVNGFGQSSGTGSSVVVALYRGSTCVFVRDLGSNLNYSDIGFTFIDAPASTSQQTYSVRIGCSASAQHFYTNGKSSGRLFGGTASMNMRLEELEAH